MGWEGKELSDQREGLRDRVQTGGVTSAREVPAEDDDEDDAEGRGTATGCALI